MKFGYRLDYVQSYLDQQGLTCAQYLTGLEHGDDRLTDEGRTNVVMKLRCLQAVKHLEEQLDRMGWLKEFWKREPAAVSQA